jgi:two-component system OmpR family response regulator/two-component system response regulator TctD
MGSLRIASIPTMSVPLQIVLVEDDTLLRDSLASYLTLVGFAVTAVGDGLSLYRLLGAHKFAVAVIDLGLPDEDGTTLVSYLRRNTDSAIIVITARDTLDSRVECYRVGADLFLGKPVDGGELAAAIASLAGRRSTVAEPPPAVAVAMADASSWTFVTRQRALLSPAARRVELAVKECQLLTALVAEGGCTAKRLMLLEAIYGQKDSNTERALDTLVRRTRRKIEMATGTPAPILTEHGVGYAFVANICVVAD